MIARHAAAPLQGILYALTDLARVGSAVRSTLPADDLSEQHNIRKMRPDDNVEENDANRPSYDLSRLSGAGVRILHGVVSLLALLAGGAEGTTLASGVRATVLDLPIMRSFLRLYICDLYRRPSWVAHLPRAQLIDMRLCAVALWRTVAHGLARGEQETESEISHEIHPEAERERPQIVWGLDPLRIMSSGSTITHLPQQPASVQLHRLRWILTDMVPSTPIPPSYQSQILSQPPSIH